MLWLFIDSSGDQASFVLYITPHTVVLVL